MILVVAGFIIWRQAARDPQQNDANGTRVVATLANWQARYLVGAAKTFDQPNGQQFADAARTDNGTIEQRLANVVVIGEISGPEAAIQKLKQVEEVLTVNEGQDSDWAAAALHKVYDDRIDKQTTLPSVDETERRRLVERLGWSGELALHPAGSPDTAVRDALLADARRTFIGSIVMISVLGCAALAGFAVLVALCVALVVRPKSSSVSTTLSSKPAPHTGIYAETFALWMMLHVAFSYLAAWLPVNEHHFLLMAAFMFAGLAALAWPIFRGVAWSVVRDDLGLNLGRRPLVEMLLGPVAYLTAMPLLVVGVLAVVALMSMQSWLLGDVGGELSSGQLPSHPIVGWLLEADWWHRLQIIFLASVMAPLVEETMFRGALYLQLRAATARFGYAGSVVVSALVVSFVFAAIHPQGLITVPALMALAIAFTLAREWRGTLLPAMLAHGLNNFLVTCALLSLS